MYIAKWGSLGNHEAILGIALKRGCCEWLVWPFTLYIVTGVVINWWQECSQHFSKGVTLCQSEGTH